MGHKGRRDVLSSEPNMYVIVSQEEAEHDVRLHAVTADLAAASAAYKETYNAFGGKRQVELLQVDDGYTSVAGASVFWDVEKNNGVKVVYSTTRYSSE